MLVQTRRELDQMVNAIAQSRVIAFDTETNGLNIRGGCRMVGMSVYTDYDAQTYYLPVRHGVGLFYSEGEQFKSSDNGDGSKRVNEALLNPLLRKVRAKQLADFTWSPKPSYWRKIYRIKDVPADVLNEMHVKTDREMRDLRQTYPQLNRFFTLTVRKKPYVQRVYDEQIKPNVLRSNVPVEWLNEVIAVWHKPELHVAHNAQFDLTVLHYEGFPTPKRLYDTMVALQAVFSDWNHGRFPMRDTGNNEYGSRGLKWQARLWGLDKASDGIDELAVNVKKMIAEIERVGGKSCKLQAPNSSKSAALLWALPSHDVALYAEDDTRLTYLLWEKIREYLIRWDDEHLGEWLSDIVLNVSWPMEQHGFRLDVERGKEIVDEFAPRLIELRDDVERLSGGMIVKPGSAQQIKAYTDAIGLGLPNTQKKTLEPYSDRVPVIDKVLDYRQIKKLLQTYVKKWTDNAIDGYVHPTVNVAATNSLRNSSSSQFFNNFQNIPRPDERAPFQPKLVLLPPREDMIIVDIDYSNLELRVGAWIAENVLPHVSPEIKAWTGDRVLTRMVENGEDMHRYTALKAGVLEIMLAGGEAYDFLVREGYDTDAIRDRWHEKDATLSDDVIWIKEVERIARQSGKTVNFATMYGAGEPGIMRSIGGTREMARALLNGWREAYPALPYAMKEIENAARKPRPEPGREERKIMYITSPVPGLQFHYKYHFYPTYIKTRDGGAFNPLQKAAYDSFNRITQGPAGTIMNDAIRRYHAKYGVASYKLVNGAREYDFSTGPIIPMITVHDDYAQALRPQDLTIVKDLCTIMVDYPIVPHLDVEIEACLPGEAWGTKQVVHDVDLWIQSGGLKGFEQKAS